MWRGGRKGEKGDGVDRKMNIITGRGNEEESAGQLGKVARISRTM